MRQAGLELVLKWSFRRFPKSIMKFTLNGHDYQVDDTTLTVAELIARLTLSNAQVAVERNAVLVPKVQHSLTAILDNDRIEIVTFVGGG